MPTPTASTGALVEVATRLLIGVLDEFPNHETTLLSFATSGIGIDEPTQLAFGVDDADVSGGSPKELELEALDDFSSTANRTTQGVSFPVATGK